MEIETWPFFLNVEHSISQSPIPPLTDSLKTTEIDMESYAYEVEFAGWRSIRYD